MYPCERVRNLPLVVGAQWQLLGTCVVLQTNRDVWSDGRPLVRENTRANGGTDSREDSRGWLSLFPSRIATFNRAQFVNRLLWVRSRPRRSLRPSSFRLLSSLRLTQIAIGPNQGVHVSMATLLHARHVPSSSNPKEGEYSIKTTAVLKLNRTGYTEVSHRQACTLSVWREIVVSISLRAFMFVVISPRRNDSCLLCRRVPVTKKMHLLR